MAESSSVSTMMKVTVSGTLDIPIRLDLLGGLQDPVMEEEILKECARLSVSERLGYFDAMDVKVTFNSAGKRACNVTLDLARLGQCIGEIQAAYEHLLAHAQLLQALLTVEDAASVQTEHDLAALAEAIAEGQQATPAPAPTTTAPSWHADKEAKMLALVARMLAAPPSVVDAAAMASSSEGEEAPDVAEERHGEVPQQPHRVHSQDAHPDAMDYRAFDPERASAGKGLLDAEEEDEDDDVAGGGSADDEPIDYEAMGYTRF